MFSVACRSSVVPRGRHGTCPSAERKTRTRVPVRRRRSKAEENGGARLEMWPRARYGGPVGRGGEVMRVETQLSAFIENRAGVLAELAADLARHGISIRALTVANLVDHAVVRLVVSEPQKALHLLGDRGVLAVSPPVLPLDMPDEAGAPARIAQRLGRAG